MPNVAPWERSKALAQIHAAQAASDMVDQQAHMIEALKLLVKEQQANSLLTRIALYVMTATLIITSLPYIPAALSYFWFLK